MDDEERKVVKKKVVKKVVKRPADEGQAPQGDDALSAFGITEAKDASKAKFASPVTRPGPGPSQQAPATGPQDQPKKVVPKKVIKKVVKRPEEAPVTAGTAVAVPKPAAPAPTVEPVKDEGAEDAFVVEPVEENVPDLVETVTAPPTAKPHDAMAEEPKGGGVKERVPAPPKAPTATAEAPVTEPVEEVGDADLDKADRMLENLNLDDLTKNIQEDLLETFENKIDDILVDIIEDENSVEELSKPAEGPKPEARPATRPAEPAPPKTVAPPAPAKPEKPVEDDLDAFLADIKAPERPVSPSKPGTPRTEVKPRPEVKLEADVESPKKPIPADEPVTMDKSDEKILSDAAAPPKKEDVRPAPADAGTASEPLRIEEGDVRERRVAFKVASNFNKLPPNMRNELLRNLAKVGDPKVREDVVCAIATHFKSLPADVQALMTNLARDENIRVREEVVFEIEKNFANISAQVRERILKAMVLDKEATVREEVVSAICAHYKELTGDVQAQLRNLAKDKVQSVRENLSFELQKADSPVPKEVREELLGILKGTR